MEKVLKSSKDLLEAGLIKENSISLVDEISKGFSTSITSQVYNNINRDDPDDPIFRQYVPQKEELNVLQVELEDPIGDNLHSPVKGIVHNYPDRCLLKLVNVCPVYCRFCFRKELIGPGSEFLSNSDLEKALDYIKNNDKIWDVILTGGDPLILSPKKIKYVIDILDKIPHVGVIRIHTRVPVVKSESINNELISVLKISKPVFVVVHANHAKEFTKEAQEACARLVDNGIPLLSQSVLLKGVNNSIEALSELMRTFIRNRIKPYYIHHGDYAKGTSHFRITIKEGQQLMHKLRTAFSGLCQPTYILEIPSGKGKIPIDYAYIKESSSNGQEEKYIVEGHRGDFTSYPLDND